MNNLYKKNNNKKFIYLLQFIPSSKIEKVNIVN